MLPSPLVPRVKAHSLAGDRVGVVPIPTRGQTLWYSRYICALCSCKHVLMNCFFSVFSCALGRDDGLGGVAAHRVLHQPVGGAPLQRRHRPRLLLLLLQPQGGPLALPPGRLSGRVGKNPGLKKNQPSGFFCFFWVFGFFLGFLFFLGFCFFYIFAQKRVFRVFLVLRILLGASRL